MGDSERGPVWFVVGVGGAIGLGVLLVPLRALVTASNLAFAFIVLTILVAEMGGRGPGLAAAAVSALSLKFFLTEPYLSLEIRHPDDVVAFVARGACGLVAAAFGRRRARAADLATRTREDLEVLGRNAERRAAGAELGDVLEDLRRAFGLSGIVLRHQDERLIAAAPRARPLSPRPRSAGAPDGSAGDRPARTRGARARASNDRTAWRSTIGPGRAAPVRRAPGAGVDTPGRPAGGAAAGALEGPAAWLATPRRRRRPPVGGADAGLAARLDPASPLLVRLDRALEVPVLRARKEAEPVEPGQVRLRLGEVAHGEVGLADVLVGAAVLRVEGKRLLVEGDGARRVAAPADRVGQPVEGVGVRPVPGDDALEERHGRRVLARLDGPDASRVVGVLGAGRLGAAAAPAATTAPVGHGAHRSEHERQRQQPRRQWPRRTPQKGSNPRVHEGPSPPSRTPAEPGSLTPGQRGSPPRRSRGARDARARKSPAVRHGETVTALTYYGEVDLVADRRHPPLVAEGVALEEVRHPTSGQAAAG